MGEKTDLINEIKEEVKDAIEDAAEEFKPPERRSMQDFVKENMALLSTLGMVLTGGVSGVAVDELGGGAAARAAFEKQVQDIQESTGRELAAVESVIDSCQEERDRAYAAMRNTRDLFLQCNEARLEERPPMMMEFDALDFEEEEEPFYEMEMGDY